MCCLYSWRHRGEPGNELSCLSPLTLPIECLTQTSIFEQGLFNLLLTLECCYNSIPCQPAAAFPKQHLKTTLDPGEEMVSLWFEAFSAFSPPTYIYISHILKCITVEMLHLQGLSQEDMPWGVYSQKNVLFTSFIRSYRICTITTHPQEIPFINLNDYT